MPADPMVLRGRILPNTPLARVAAALGDGEAETAEVLAGDVADVLRLMDQKGKAAADLKARIAPHKAVEKVALETGALQAMVELARKAAAAGP